MTIYKIGDQLYQNGELVQSQSDVVDTTTTTTTETPGQTAAPDGDLTWQDVLDAAHDIYEMVSDPKESVVGDVIEGWLEAFGADEAGPKAGKAITDFMNDVFGSGGANFQMVGPSELEGTMLGPNGELMIFNPETGEYEYADDKGRAGGVMNDYTIIASPEANEDQHDNSQSDDHNDDHSGFSPGDTTDDPKEPDGTPPGNPDGDMPNPDGTGPGSPTATPNPEGDDGEGSEGGRHGVLIGHGGNGGGGDGEGEGPGRLGMSQQLSGGGNNQQGGTGGPGHGPHDPGEEMPNPEDGRGGNPTSNVAHGAHDFWNNAAGVSQGVTSGLHVSTIVVSQHASQITATFNAAVTTSAHDLTGALSGASGHDDVAHTASTGAHAVAAAVSSELHGELGTTTLHDTLSIHGASIATQMHV